MPCRIAITFAAAFFAAFAANGQPAKPAAENPDTRGVKIDEAHRTSPPNTPQREEQDGQKQDEATAGTSRPPAEKPDTRGVKIDEAHRTAPVNKPENKQKRHDDSP